MNNVIQSSSSQDSRPSVSFPSDYPPETSQEPIRLFPSQHHPTIASNDDGRLQSQRRMRLDYLETFLRQLDSLLFVQFSILYYYDNTFILFILRATVQAFFLTPRPTSLSDSPLHRPSIGAIGASNSWCLFLHLIRSNPQAGEVTEGFLHGGLIIDFVGELSPIWKWRLVAMDLLILGLQLVMLAATLKKFSLKTKLSDIREQTIVQDHDSEERGILRDESRPEGEHNELLDDPSNSETTAASTGNTLDALYTGEHIIANLSLLGTVKRQWGVYQNESRSGIVSGSNVHTGNDITMLFGGLLGVRLRFRGRMIGV